MRDYSYVTGYEQSNVYYISHNYNSYMYLDIYNLMLLYCLYNSLYPNSICLTCTGSWQHPQDPLNIQVFLWRLRLGGLDNPLG